MSTIFYTAVVQITYIYNSSADYHICRNQKKDCDAIVKIG